MATGPCGVEFREAFTCFHYSDAEPKGGDCLEPFRTMSSCMAQYPGVYGSGEDNVMAVRDEEEDDERPTKDTSSSASEKSVAETKDSGKEVASSKSW